MLEKIIRDHIPEPLKVNRIRDHFKQPTSSLLDLEEKTSLSGETPLHLAVSYGLSEVVKLLVDLGSDIDSLDIGHQTPLHYAAESGHPHLIIAFGHWGALLNLKDEQGDTPMHKAIQGKHPTCVIALLKASNFTLDTTVMNRQKKTPWDCLKYIEDLKIQQVLAEALNTRADPFGRSPFHVDVIHGALKLVKAHAESGVNQQDKYGNTALHLAVMCGHRDIVFYLCREYEGEINLDIQNNQGNTPLHLSAERRDGICMKILVSGKKSARKDIKNIKGMVPEEIIRKWCVDDEEIKVLEDALASSYLTNMLSEDYENELFPPDPPRPSGYMGYLGSDKELKILTQSLASPHFERKFSRRLSEGSKSQIRLVPPTHHRKGNRPKISLSLQEMLDSTEADIAEQALVHPEETEGESFVEKAFVTHDINYLVYLIQQVKTASNCQFILKDFKKFIKKIRSENANIFLQVFAENLVPVSTKVEDDFNKDRTRVEKSFHKKLCTDGLIKMFSIKEINLLTVKDFDAISTDEVIQKKLQALVKLCSGVPENAKNANVYLFDSIKLKVNLSGLIDFNEIEEIILLLSKLNPYFSNIQKLASHFIVFNIIEKCHDFSFDLDQGSVAKSINFYVNNFCEEGIKNLLLEYKNLIHVYQTSSPHSLIQQINSLIDKTVNSKKESIISKIAEYMSKSPAELKGTEMEYRLVDSICRAFTETNTKFFQSFEIRKWRGKCYDVTNREVATELLEHNVLNNLMSSFIKKVILSYSSPQKQSQAMMLFLLVAREALHNRPYLRDNSKIAAPDFTTAAAVYFVILQNDITKLKLMSFLDKDAKKIEKALTIIFNPKGGFRAYDLLQSADHRCLPFIQLIFCKKNFMYQYEPFNYSESLGEIYDALIFVKNRLSKVVFLDAPSDLEELLQQLKHQSLDDDSLIRKRSSDKQRLSQRPPAKEIKSPRKLSTDENPHVPRKKSSADKKMPKLKSLSLEDIPATTIEHPEEGNTLRRTSAPRKTSSGQGTSPRKELQERESLTLKHLAAETQKHSERKVPLLRRLSNERRLSTKIIHSDKQETSPRDGYFFPDEGLVVPFRFSSGEGSSNEHSDHEIRSESSFQKITKPIRHKLSLSGTPPRNFPNPASMFHTQSSSSSSEEENLNPDATSKNELR